MTAKKTAKKTPKKRPPPRSHKPPSTAALAKRVKTLEDEVKKLKAAITNGDQDSLEMEGMDSLEMDGFVAETTKDGSIKYTPIKDTAQDGDDVTVEDVSNSTLLHKLNDLVMGKMTTTIRQTESRVKTCEERLDDCEGFLLENFPEEEKGDDTDADVTGP